MKKTENTQRRGLFLEKKKHNFVAGPFTWKTIRTTSIVLAGSRNLSSRRTCPSSRFRFRFFIRILTPKRPLPSWQDRFCRLIHGPIPASFSLISVLFNSNINYTNWKKRRLCAWDSNPVLQVGRCSCNHWAIAAAKQVVITILADGWFGFDQMSKSVVNFDISEAFESKQVKQDVSRTVILIFTN